MEQGFDRRHVVAGLSGLGLSALARPSAAALTRTVAITFDDLPFAGTASADEVFARNRKVLDCLRRFKAPATGFVIEKTVESFGRDGLKAWTEGDFSLGNHTYSHADTNRLDLTGIEREVVDGEASIRPLMEAAGKPLRFVRFAMNHTGDPLDKSLAIEDMLRRHGYVSAASTIDTSDYVFEEAYTKALQAADRDAASRITDAYVAYSATEIDYYVGLSQKVLGYEPPQIALLHLNRINCDTLDRILDLYVRRRFGFVTLEAAQADPAYALPTTFATRFGPMWGYRWAKEKGIRVDGSLEQEPPSWISEYAAGKN